MKKKKDIIPDTSSILQNSEAVYRISAFQYHETLQNIMERDVYCCRPDDEIHSVAEEMAKRRISSVIITDEKLKPVGIVTERDMVRKVVADSEHSKFGRMISEIMTPNPVCLPPESTLFDALSMLSRYTINHPSLNAYFSAFIFLDLNLKFCYFMKY